MMKRVATVFSLSVQFILGTAVAQETARGVVFHDVNENGVRDRGENGVPNVGVSNGFDVVQTDRSGAYTLQIDSDEIIFVIKPAGWCTSVDDNNLPRFYYIHKPAGSPASEYGGVPATGPLPASIDFPLVRQQERDTFQVIFFGDTQPRNIEEVNYIAHDVVEDLIGTPAAFGVTLGDIVFDDLSVFPVLNGVVGRIGVPWYNVIGNHDLNMDTSVDETSDETYERIYGPAYYSFNYARVHFIVLDNVAWEGKDYHGKIGERQMQFVRNDLMHVPADRLVVLMMHIPLQGVDDYRDLLSILAERPHTFSISAHWHRQGNFFLTDSGPALEGHHHLVHGTVSGSWWTGIKDEYGIPHATMSDGTPNGYSIGTFSGTDYKLTYRAARRPPEFQMSVFTPEAVSSTNTENIEVVVNVFMGSTQSIVEMRVGNNGEWIPLQKTERPDPYYVASKQYKDTLAPEAGRKSPDPANSTHLWAANLPANIPIGTHVIYVRTTDMFGQSFYAHRILRVE